MDDAAKQLKDKWFLIVFLAGLILWYGSTNSRLNAVEAKVADQQNTIEQIADIKVDIAVIKTNVSYIKTQLDNRK